MKFLVQEIFKPISRRVGTYAAGIATTYGVITPEQETQTAMLIASAVLVGVDLLVSGVVRGAKK